MFGLVGISSFGVQRSGDGTMVIVGRTLEFLVLGHAIEDAINHCVQMVLVTNSLARGRCCSC